MSNMEIEPNGADQMALSQANAASAAHDSDTSEIDELLEDEEQIQAEITRLEAEQKSAQQKALKEMLANNGFAYRNILRTIARIEQLEIEACERLGIQLQLGHLELNGELDCSETDTARQYTLYLSDSEEDLISEQNSS